MKKSHLLLFFAIFHFAFSQLREFNFYLETEDSLPAVNLSSVETVPCAGYGIQAFRLWNHDTVIIDIRGFIRPEPCYSGTDVARGRIVLNGIKTRAFVVKFRWKKRADLWSIELRGKSFTILPIRSTFTSYSK